VQYLGDMGKRVSMATDIFLGAMTIQAYGEAAKTWVKRHRGQRPHFICTLGFTETALIPGISAAGATPEDRRYTALADAEFLAFGLQKKPQYPLPPLTAGVSPAVISRAIVSALDIPLTIVNAGLATPPPVTCLDLQQSPARCVSTGEAMARAQVEALFEAGLSWGKRWGRGADYLVLGECVVGGTTTALAVLLGLGIDAIGLVNSSHGICNHDQKTAIARRGLSRLYVPATDVFDLMAAVGDPMQPFVAGVAIGASRHCGVMLAGGTQMLAVYGLARRLEPNLDRVVVGTTRWVMDDPTGNTLELAKRLGNVPLVATQMNFSQSRYTQLQRYEQGYVKEGVGAGGMAIAAHLLAHWEDRDYLAAIEALMD
jgi:uncharacterized protein (TIGR00303 family)